MVFDSVVGATIKKTSNGGPLVTKSRVSLDNSIIFIRSEGTVLDFRGKLITPPKTTGFTRSTRDRLANKRPIPRAVVMDETAEQLILIGTPRTLNTVSDGSH